MEEHQKGPITKMFDWTLSIMFLVIVIGITWKYAVYPLFFGWY